jgi:radical SAM protein with 4Fe4S-binding SPASM domain
VAKNELSLQEIKGIIDWLKSENTYKITISGGEPFARDDIFDILKYAVESGMTTHIFSNVSLLSKDMITELSKMGIAKIEASVYAYSSKAYKAITGSSTRDKVYDNLEYLADTEIEIVAKTPVLSVNCKELGQMSSIFAKLGILHIVDPLQIRGGHFEELSTDTFCDISLLEESLDNIHYEWSASNDRSDLSKQVCGGGSRNIMIDATGRVYPCASLRIGDYNIREMKIEKIWGNGLLRKHHQLKENHLKKCIGCKNKDICPYCPGRAYITTGDMKTPDKYFCDTISLLKKYSIREQHE